MTLYNLTIEAGGRVAPVAPDDLTFDFVQGLPMACDAFDWRPVPFNGWNDTDLLLQSFGPTITAFEARQRVVQPWLYGAAR